MNESHWTKAGMILTLVEFTAIVGKRVLSKSLVNGYIMINVLGMI